MDTFQIPLDSTIKTIRGDVSLAMKGRFYCNKDTNTYEKKVCAICDNFVTIDNPESTISAAKLAKYCERSGAKVSDALEFFPEPLVSTYKNVHPLLSNYVLSPLLKLKKLSTSEELVIICHLCNTAYNIHITKYGGETSKKNIPCPPRAIWNGNFVGEIPDVLLSLTLAEAALISPNRILSHGMVVYADQHRGVYGWHALYENNVESNLGNIDQLIRAGLKGEMVCVLCGPFTRAQQTVLRNQLVVRHEYMVRAFEWLKKYNHFFRNFCIPEPDSFKAPVLLYNDDL